MAHTIKLTSVVPVVAPGDTITVTAKVTNDDDSAAEGITVNWSLGDGSNLATLGSTSSVTSDTGYTSNTVTSDVKADLTIIATLDEGTGSPSDSLNIGFYSTELKAPIVPQASSDGNIDEKAIKQGIQVMILQHTNDPAVSDLYTFYWGSNSRSRLDAGTMPWIFNLTDLYQPSEVLSDGIYTVYYTVADTSNNVTYSQPLSITVSGGTYIDPLYQPPEFPDVSDNTVNYDFVKEHGGLPVKIPYPQDESPGLYAGDVISFYMKVFDKSYVNEIISSTLIMTYTITSDDITNSKIEFNIDESVITDSNDTFDDVRGEFWYMVSGEGSVAVSGTSYSKNLIIDTVPPY